MRRSEEVETFESERAHLTALAFRLLGAQAEAQDAVQEAWLRWNRTDRGALRNPAAWLTTVVTRLCLDQLRRARERPMPPADLPESEVESAEETALVAEHVTGALSLVLDELSPPQRVAFILHDVFGTPFEEVGRTLGVSTVSAKKLASRARARIRRADGPAEHDPEAARPVVAAFLRAAREGDLDGLLHVLHPDVVRTADPQALPPGAAQRVQGATAISAETRALREGAAQARLVEVAGHPAIAVGAGPRLVILCTVAAGRIVRYDVVADPQRLAALPIGG